MITIRVDDVLCRSRGHTDPFQTFSDMHNALQACKVLRHEPAILVNEIQEFPVAIELIRAETAAGNMSPQIHGWQHIDYGKLTKEQILEDLKKCIDWFHSELNFNPTKFYTPWGANTAPMRLAAEELGIALIGVTRGLTLDKLANHLKKGIDITDYRHTTWLWHWWAGLKPFEDILLTIKNNE